MTRHISLLIAIGLVIIGLFYYSKNFLQGTIPTEQKYAIIFPKGGEELLTGQTYKLLWNDGIDPINIFLIDRSLKEQGASVSVSDRVYGIKNEHSYDYTVPATIKPGEYEFQIGTETSKPFRIVDK